MRRPRKEYVIEEFQNVMLILWPLFILGGIVIFVIGLGTIVRWLT